MSSKLTAAEKKKCERALAERLLAGEKTFGELWPVASDTLTPAYADGYRFTDAWLQRERRDGRINYVRRGRDVFWRLTDDGRAALSGKPAEQGER